MRIVFQLDHYVGGIVSDVVLGITKDLFVLRCILIASQKLSHVHRLLERVVKGKEQLPAIAMLSSIESGLTNEVGSDVVGTNTVENLKDEEDGS